MGCFLAAAVSSDMSPIKFATFISAFSSSVFTFRKKYPGSSARSYVSRKLPFSPVPRSSPKIQVPTAPMVTFVIFASSSISRAACAFDSLFADTLGTNTRKTRSRAAITRTPDKSIFLTRLTWRTRLILFLLIFLSIFTPLLQQMAGFAVHVWYYIEKMLPI